MCVFFCVCRRLSKSDRVLNTAQRLTGKARRAHDRLQRSWFIWQAVPSQPRQMTECWEWRLTSLQPSTTDTTPAISGDFYSSRVSWARVGGWHAVQKVWNLLIVQEIVQEMSFSSRTFSICAFHGRMCHMWLLGKLTLLFRFAFAEKRNKMSNYCSDTVWRNYNRVQGSFMFDVLEAHPVL